MAKKGNLNAGKKTNAEVKEITDAEFEPFAKESNIAVIDFFAEWCMPCVMMVPVLEELAKHFNGKVAFAKINVDESKKIASEHKIMSIPTLLVFKKNALVGRITGASSFEMLKEKINAYL